jgi:hypothetical protein
MPVDVMPGNLFHNKVTGISNKMNQDDFLWHQSDECCTEGATDTEG